MNLSSDQRRYLFVAQGLLPFAINVVICGLIGLIDFCDRQTLPIWGLPQSIALDLKATCFLLPCITTLICTPLTRRDVRRTRSPVTHPGERQA